MNSAQILHQLQLLDSELGELKNRLRDARGRLVPPPDLVAARSAHEEAVKALAQWQSRLRDLELRLQGLSDKIAETEKRLYGGQVQNPKELASLQQEQQHSLHVRRELEDEVLMAMSGVEEAGAAQTRLSQIRMAAEARFSAQQDEANTTLQAISAAIAELNARRREIIPTIRPQDLALYEELLQKKGGRAVVLLVGQSCQGCRVTIPSSKAAQVRRGEVLTTCMTCGRILVPDV